MEIEKSLEKASILRNYQFDFTYDMEIEKESTELSQLPMLSTNESAQFPHLIEENKSFTEIPTLIRLTEPAKSSCKKNSLKFCRRITKLLIEQLSDPNSDYFPIISQFASFFQTSLQMQMDLFNGTISNPKGENLHLELIKKVWLRNRGILSEKKNNRLSLVSYEEWDRMFSFNGFCHNIEKVTNNYELLLKKTAFVDEFNANSFIGFYLRLLYTLNFAILNLIIFDHLNEKKDIYILIPELENFAIMVTEPWIYKHYNHTKAKFALECCGTCKVCRSTLLPKDFQARLASARGRYKEVWNLFLKQISEWNLKESPLNISPIFMFLASEIWS